MERELWPELHRAVRQVGSRVRQTGVTYQPWVIALVVLWAAIHDRPLSWACRSRNWSTTRLQPMALPAASTISRRAHGVGLGIFWRLLGEHLRNSDAVGLLSFIDGKPLLVGGASKDPDARRGRGAGGFAKGYKLHEIRGNRCLPEAWEITPLNAAESVVGQGLVAQAAGGGYLLGDGNYDSSTLFDCAQQAGYQLLTPCENAQVGRGHRRRSPARLRSIALFPTPFGTELRRQRIGIEQSFAHLSSFGGGLAPLPN